jgi:hypothetical protein
MSSFRPRSPSAGLVVAIVALIVALGGTSYAAFSLPKNSVGTKQIKNGAVTGSKINLSTLGTVHSADTANSAAFANNANNAAHANEATHASSADGATNATTAATANALSGVQIVDGPIQALAAGTQGNQTVGCPAGMVAIGGNEINNSTSPAVSLNSVSIFGSGGGTNNTVKVWMNNESGGSIGWNAYAVCVSGSETGTVTG